MGAGYVSQFRLGAGPKMTDSEDSDTNVQAPWREGHNYELNSDTVLRDAYRILCVVMADRAIMEFVATDNLVNLVNLRYSFAQDELLHTVIQLAVMNRIQLDNMNKLRSDPDERSFDPIEINCGELIENDGPNSDKKCLSFREACNKIIHAEKIIVKPDENGDSVFPGRKSTLILCGTKNQNPWQAELDILQFLYGTLKNFD